MGRIKRRTRRVANRDYEHLKEVDRLFEEAKAKDAEEDKLYGKDRRGADAGCVGKEGRLKMLQARRV